MRENTKEKSAGIAKAVIYLLIVLVIAGTAIFLVMHFTKESEPEITNSFISDKLEAASELTSAKLTYNGLVRYSEGSIPFITKKEFSMIYRAEVKAGIDLSKVKSEITDTQVKITVPRIEILDISIDESSIQFYDEKFALLNWEKKEDLLETMQEAKADVEAKGDMDGLKENAKNQIQILLVGLFEDCIGERELVIELQ